MFAKMVLPLLGGSPSVWTTCMLFFQSGLLAGYAYAHAIGRWRRVRTAALVHALVVLVPLATLPMALPAGASAVDELHPVAWLLRTMLVSVGLPFFVLATTAPLLQRWFALADSGAGHDPYFLYAASNAGSLIALIAFPSVIEPLLPLSGQTRAWTAGYVTFAALTLACIGMLLRARPQPAVPAPADDGAQRPTVRTQLEWLALSFVPSSLMLAVTTYLSTDVAAVPLLWIVPLTIYLGTFIVAFGPRRERAVSQARRALPLVLLPLLMLVVAQGEAAWWFALPLHLLSFAALSVLCLGRLVRTRPGTRHLTRFYLWLAAGGALGGVFNTIVAPALFNGVAEYPLVIAAACFILAVDSGLLRPLRQPRLLTKPVLVGLLTLGGLLLNQRLLGAEPRGLFLFLGAPAVLCFSLSRDPARFAYAVALLLVAGAVGETPAWGRVLHAERTFFGVYRISESADGRFVTLYHGTTVHGRQARGNGRPEPLTYYRPESPIADVLRAVDRPLRSVGVVGLGVGSLASYARPGEAWTFYEIDPAVERMARDSRFFTYLQSCEACTVVVGDARVSLEANEGTHDLLVLDAFSSDAIPIHLLTREALDVYARRLPPGGVMAVHISNRHVELRPVLARLARDRRWSAAARFDVVPESLQSRYSSSDWVVLASHAGSLAGIQRDPRWVTLRADAAPAWSDDFSNIWTALRWR